MFTCYLGVTFHTFLNGQLTCRLSGPSCPPLVQWHPYPLVPHDLSQPSVPTLQSHMLSFSPASLPSSPSCPLHNPSVPNLQSFMPFFSHTSLQSHMLSFSPASLPSSPSCPLHNPSIPNLQSFMPVFMYTSLLSGHSCPPSAQHPYPPVTHEMPSLSPSIPTLQSLAAYFNPAFPELCNPTLRSLLPSLSPACSLKLL